jgi:hypothetical protein
MNSLRGKRVVSLALAGAALIVFQVAAVQKAFAHHPNVTATATCSNGVGVINYTASSWDPGNPNGDGDNPEIDILFNGVALASGAFLPSQVPPDQFSGTVDAPQGASTVDVQAIAVGMWGDSYPAGDVSGVVTVTIPTNCSTGIGRFTGGGKQVSVGNVVVTKGFEVDCDLHQPSNNLEINWSNPGESGSHHFHMTAFLAAVCTLVKKPNPPTAPVNTIVAMGTGRFDNIDGYTVQFELVDNGEPGTSDAAMFKVYETANPGNVVLNCPLEVIATGNIQAHVDQH